MKKLRVTEEHVTAVRCVADLVDDWKAETRRAYDERSYREERASAGDEGPWWIDVGEVD